ncbi:MAG TPA: divalent metal cation transporter [Sphingomicrobium sp.]|nr:divalent metal cation transporter [Sphingomicrobium sp.]
MSDDPTAAGAEKPNEGVIEAAVDQLLDELPTPTHAKRRFIVGLGRLGPGLITGAADDDPSGIATYSQAGAQFGLDLLWPMLFTYPLMVAVQAICARIGRVTGRGLAYNLRQVFPRWAVVLLVLSLFVANTINIGADIAAMGASAQLLVGRGQMLFTMMFAAVSLLLQVLVPYRRYVKGLKWLTLVLFAYVLIAFTVKIDWTSVATHTVLPRLYGTSNWITVIVAIFGTTISPYLFFWQSSEEVEIMEVKDKPALTVAAPPAARHELQRIEIDTFIGMGMSNLIAFFIILTTAVTLHQHGVTDIQTSAQAAQALRPVVGSMAFVVFSLGLIGTGLLAVPVLAGSTAYAASETFDWEKGLEKPFAEARSFYAVIIISMVIAVGVLFSPLDPIKALFWSAVINGIIAVPILAAMMIVASRRDEMGVFVATPAQRIFGWLATLVMAAASIGMFVL